MASGINFGSGSMPDSEWKSMLDITKKRLLNMLTSLNQNSNQSVYRVLVLDHRATRVLGACLRMFDITQEGVALVESLEKNRRPFPEMEAVYIMEPSRESVQRLVKDFESVDNPLYSRANVFFLQRCVDEIFELIKGAPLLAARITTLVEFNLNYLALEENMFHFDIEDALVRLYNSDKDIVNECTNEIVDSLVTFCASLNEYPFVRYEETNALCSKIAIDFQTKFNSFLINDTGFWWRGDGGDGHGDIANRATLIVLDRAEDAVVPLLHSFTYQAMVYDLLNVQDNVCRYYKGDLNKYRGQDMDPELHNAPLPGKDSEVAVALLKEEDALWVEFRHMHITKVIDRLNAHLKTYMATNIGKMRARENGETASLEEMNRAIQELPEYQEMMEKHAQHIKLTQLCMRKLEEQKLLECARVEQLLATGVDADGKEHPDTAVLDDLTVLVKDPAVNTENTTRLLALYIVTQRGIKDEVRRQLLDAANPPLPDKLQNALLGLGFMGVRLQQQAAPAKKTAAERKQILDARHIAATSEDQYGRYQPKIATLVSLICKRTLPTDKYTYVIEPPPMLLDVPKPSVSSFDGKSISSSVFGSSFASAFMKKKPEQDLKSPPSSASSSDNDNGSIAAGGGVVLSVRSKPNKCGNIKEIDPVSSIKGSVTRNKRAPKGSRVIVFITGGATPSEMAAIANVMKENNRDVVVGATHVITPKMFVHDLQFLQHPELFFAEREQKKEKARAAAQAKLAIQTAEAGFSAAQEDLQEMQVLQKPSKGSLFACGCMRG